MTYSPAQYSPNAQTVAEFTAVMRQALPYLERLILVARQFCEDGDISEQESPCSTCKEKHLGCDKTCEHIERLLPKEYGGKMHKERTINLNLDLIGDTSISEDERDQDNDIKRDHSTLGKIHKVQSIDVFSEYQKCWTKFTKKQRLVLFLYHKEGKSMKQIAKELGKAQSTICGLLKRADEREKKYDDEQHEKILKLMKKNKH